MPLNLEQLRKRAKDLRRAHRQGDVAAAARIVAHLPRAAGRSAAQVLAEPFALTEAQLVVAREAGFPSWPRLRQAVDGRIESALDAALAGTPVVAPDPVPVHLAAALGDAHRALAALAADPGLATRVAGLRQWTPLRYACFARHGRGDTAVAAGRVAIVERLLALGADPNEEIDGPAGRESPLRGAARHVAGAELVDLLVRAGASLLPTDATTGRSFPLVDAVAGGNPACVARLLAAEPPWWQVREALETAVRHDDAASARLLLDHGAHPSEAGRWWGNGGSCLHSAILLGRGPGLLEVLLASDVDLAARDRDGRTAYAVAVRTGHDEAAALLGASAPLGGADLDPVDRVIAACVRLDRAELDRWLTPQVRRGYRYTDHLMLGWAVRHRRFAAVPLLLAAGLDPAVPDPAGDTPLHLAVASGDQPTIEALRDAGAPTEARDFRGRTPFGRPPGRDEVFERAADAVVAGDLAALRTLLDEEPWLPQARSPRQHHATLLHYCAANGTEAPRQRTPPAVAAVAELLLERGAQVDAAARFYGGGVGTTTLALTLTSSFPADAGVDGDLVRVLTRAGARLDLWASGEPMYWCVERGTPRSASALADAGLPLDNLLLAAAADRVDLLTALLADGADVNGRHWGGYTALHGAAVLGHAGAVRFLLARGADPSLRETRYGGTAAGKARWRGHVELAALIDQAAASVGWSHNDPGPQNK